MDFENGMILPEISQDYCGRHGITWGYINEKTGSLRNLYGIKHDYILLLRSLDTRAMPEEMGKCVLHLPKKYRRIHTKAVRI